MTDYKLTAGTNNLTGSSSADNFYGWFDNPGGGATGHSDNLEGGGGKDHFYLDQPGQSGPITGGEGSDTVHARYTLGNVLYQQV